MANSAPQWVDSHGSDAQEQKLFLRGKGLLLLLHHMDLTGN